MAQPSTLQALLWILGLLVLLPSAAGGPVHDLLRAHGLPAGLLPRAVESYTMDEATGLLEVRLDRPCYARYDGPVLFDRVVRGNLTYGGLRSVEGLSQEELFLWLPVRAILVADPSSGLILLDIGAAHKRLPVSLFENPPDCRPEGEGEVEPVIIDDLV